MNAAAALLGGAPFLLGTTDGMGFEAQSNPNAQSTFDAILATCATGANGDSPDQANQRFQRDCNLIVAEGVLGDDPEGGNDAVGRITLDQVSAQNGNATRSARTQRTVIAGRLQRVRTAGRSGGDGWSLYSERGGAAGADAGFGRLGAFFNARYRTGERDASQWLEGYDFDGWGLTTGLDYRFSDLFAGGMSLSYLAEETSYDRNRGSMDTTEWGLNAYGTLYLSDGLFLDALAGYGWTDYDQNRRVVYDVNGTTSSQVAHSEPGGNLLTLSLGGGYDLVNGPLTITPQAHLEYLDNRVDGFTESYSDPAQVGGAMAQTMDAVTYSSLTSRLGVQVSRAFAVPSGVLLPRLRLTWIHEFDNDAQAIRTGFANDVNAGTNSFLIQTEEPDRDYYELSLALSAQFTGGRAAFIAYDTLLDLHRESYHAIHAGVRLEF